MKYEVKLTPPKRDGGRDVIATSKKAGRSEHVLIEVKHQKNQLELKSLENYSVLSLVKKQIRELSFVLQNMHEAQEIFLCQIQGLSSFVGRLLTSS